MEAWPYAGRLCQLLLQNATVGAGWVSSSQQALQMLTKLDIKASSLRDSNAYPIMPLQNLR